jgi:tRNA(His) 5'-end guanylyltransferase
LVEDLRDAKSQALGAQVAIQSMRGKLADKLREILIEEKGIAYSLINEAQTSSDNLAEGEAKHFKEMFDILNEAIQQTHEELIIVYQNRRKGE